MGRCGEGRNGGNIHPFACLAATAWPDTSSFQGARKPGPHSSHEDRQTCTHTHTHTCMTTTYTCTHPTSHSDLVLRTQACVNSVRRFAQDSGGILDAGPLGALLCLPPPHSDHNIRKSGKNLKQRSIRSLGILSSVPVRSCWPSECVPRSAPPLWAL